MRFWNNFAIIVSIYHSVLSQDSQPTVTLHQGKVQGTIGNTRGKNKTYYAFRGIPFAQPPLGDLRFRAPQKAKPWNGTLKATEDKSPCVQMLGKTVIGSEDCLFINVYTPQINANLAVMVWIYGGGFYEGVSIYALYNPENFLDENVVFVSFNYRLGLLGFLSTGNLDSPGNWGLKDQVLALQWVKENIKRFGGDPNNVTVFGQSAGSASVSYLTQSTKAIGLFNRGIMESGTSLCLLGLTTHAPNHAFQVGAKLGINATDTKSLVAGLRKVDYVKLKQADDEVSSLVFGLNALAGFTFGPVMEPPHKDAFFTGKSYELLRRGAFVKVPLIIGYNSNEVALAQLFLNMSTFALVSDADPSTLAPYDLTRDSLRRLLAGLLIKSHFFGSNSVATTSESSFANFYSEDQFNRPIRETVNLMSKYTSVYFYMFSYVGSDQRNYTGVSHGEELKYLFLDTPNATQSDKTTRSRLLKLWTNFAKFGNPTPGADTQLFQNVKWITAKHDLNSKSDDVNYLDIDRDLRMMKNPNQTDWLFYRDIYRRFGDGVYTTY